MKGKREHRVDFSAGRKERNSEKAVSFFGASSLEEYVVGVRLFREGSQMALTEDLFFAPRSGGRSRLTGGGALAQVIPLTGLVLFLGMSFHEFTGKGTAFGSVEGWQDIFYIGTSNPEES